MGNECCKDHSVDDAVDQGLGVELSTAVRVTARYLGKVPATVVQPVITQGGGGSSLLQSVDSGVMDVGHKAVVVGSAAIDSEDLPVGVYNGAGGAGENYVRQGRKERTQHDAPSTRLHKPKAFVLWLIPKEVRQPVGTPTTVTEPDKPGSSDPSFPQLELSLDGRRGCADMSLVAGWTRVTERIGRCLDRCTSFTTFDFGP